MATTLVWFRNCLRLHDNLSLIEAAKSTNQLVCVFVFTPSVYDPKYMGINRFHFLLQSLQDLQKQLKARYNGKLILIETKTTYKDVFSELAKSNQVSKIFFEHDSTPFAKRRDQSIREHLQKEHPKIEFTSIRHTK